MGFFCEKPLHQLRQIGAYALDRLLCMVSPSRLSLSPETAGHLGSKFVLPIQEAIPPGFPAPLSNRRQANCGRGNLVKRVLRPGSSPSARLPGPTVGILLVHGAHIRGVGLRVGERGACFVAVDLPIRTARGEFLGEGHDIRRRHHRVIPAVQRENLGLDGIAIGIARLVEQAVETRCTLEVLPRPREVENAEPAEAVAGRGNPAGIHFRLITEYLQPIFRRFCSMARSS